MRILNKMCLMFLVILMAIPITILMAIIAVSSAILAIVNREACIDLMEKIADSHRKNIVKGDRFPTGIDSHSFEELNKEFAKRCDEYFRENYEKNIKEEVATRHEPTVAEK